MTGGPDSGTLKSSKTARVTRTGGIMEVEKGTIIFLNGASSSGKTVIAKTLQQILDKPYLHFSADSFIDMLPERYISNEEQGDLSPEELEALVGLIPRMVSGFHRCIAMLSLSGVSLIVDHVLQHRPWLQECVDHLADLPVLFVGVHCPLEELERRERERDREQGTARKQFDVVHAHGIYDVEVDTSVCNPMDCALQISDALENMASAGAFNQLKEVLASETG
jgi:chloramphenicol 3-O phosphotransferase